jgi:hypothetical protein
MPKSRGRRPRKSNRKGNRSGQNRRSQTDGLTARAHAEFLLLHATDAAEVRGDAWGALQLIERDLARRGDEVFWRPDRVERLLQLAHLGPCRPRWATSRWILAQAAQALDDASRARTHRASEIALDVRGEQIDLDDIDRRAKILDHDWVFREVYLYELGALPHFLSRIASADLIAGADRIHEWARAPMGGFRFLREEPLTLTWLDLADDSEVQSLNLGTATMLEPGDCAIGRLVTIDEGAMFETAPLLVPEPLARAVAEDPLGWVTLLADVSREQAIETSVRDFRTLTDVPKIVQDLVLLETAEQLHDRPPQIERLVDVDALEQGLLRAALEQQLPELHGSVPWPAVAATLLDPRVVASLADNVTADDAPKFRSLSCRLGGPAGNLCLEIADELETRAA